MLSAHVEEIDCLAVLLQLSLAARGQFGVYVPGYSVLLVWRVI